jgi:hypothetical protein
MLERRVLVLTAAMRRLAAIVLIVGVIVGVTVGSCSIPRFAPPSLGVERGATTTAILAGH